MYDYDPLLYTPTDSGCRSNIASGTKLGAGQSYIDILMMAAGGHWRLIPSISTILLLANLMISVFLWTLRIKIE